MSPGYKVLVAQLAEEKDCTSVLQRELAVLHKALGRGKHSSTSHLNLSHPTRWNHAIHPTYPTKSAHDKSRSGRVEDPGAGRGGGGFR